MGGAREEHDWMGEDGRVETGKRRRQSNRVGPGELWAELVG